MTTSNRQRVGELVRWTARLWSLPLIAVTFLLAAGPFVPLPFNIAGRLFIGALSSLYAMGFAVAFVVAWRYESVGGWIALGSARGIQGRVHHPMGASSREPIRFIALAASHSVSALVVPSWSNREGADARVGRGRRLGSADEAPAPFCSAAHEPGLVVLADWDRLFLVHAAVLDASQHVPGATAAPSFQTPSMRAA